MIYYMMTFSYKGQETKMTSNSIPFKQGDTISVSNFRSSNGTAGWSSVNGVYQVAAITARGLSVTGSAAQRWGQGSINIPFSNPPQDIAGMTYSRDSTPPYSSVVSSGGAVISEARAFTTYTPLGTGVSTDWWLHAFITTEAGASAPSSPPVVPTKPVPVIDSVPKPVDSPSPDSGNMLNTGGGVFDIDKFIATANFKPGLSPAANAKGAADFRDAAQKAAKQARLTQAQTKKLMDAVNRAIAEGIAKAKKKPLSKPKGKGR